MLDSNRILTAIRGRRKQIQDSILEWETCFGRGYPWRENGRTPYEILIAEVLLKRTTANSAASTYPKMIARYPTLRHLMLATDEELETCLSTVGLQHQRAIALKQLARHLIEHEGSSIPDNLDRLRKVPGLGEYSARAMMSFAFDHVAAVVDSNVERVLSRLFKRVLAGQSPRTSMQEIADMIIPKKGHKLFNWGILDIGAIVCRYNRPLCGKCPLNKICDCFIESGNSDQSRGKAMSPLHRARQKKGLSLVEVSRRTGVSKSTIINIEAGRIVPLPRTVEKIATVIEIDHSELLSQTKK